MTKALRTLGNLSLRFGALIVISILVPAVGFAHITTLSQSEVTIEDHQTRMLLRVPLPALNRVLKLDKNHDLVVDEEELKQGADTIRSYLLRKILFTVNGKALVPNISDFAVWRDSEGYSFAETALVFTYPQAVRSLTLRCDLLREVDEEHRTIAKIIANERTEEFIFDGHRIYRTEERSVLKNVLQFTRLGIFHIFTGYDHIAFLVGLLLLGGSFRNVLKIVTSFTIAHSLTLALAALRIVQLPTRLVESGIALSIVYIAVENLFFSPSDRRWIVTFWFGLVHGFGFANVLQEMNLSRSGLVSSLFAFNFGVEVGQVVIVALLLPLLGLVRSTRFRTKIVRLTSAAVLALGLFWFYQRAFGR